MIFQESIIGNSRVARDQWNEVGMSRRMSNAQNRMLANQARQSGEIIVNEGLIPQDVYQEFDNVTVERMRSDDGDAFLNDLLPLSRSVNIGKLVHRFRQASDAGRAQTSMSGQIGVKSDQVEYTYDGTIIPVHDAGFHRNWREWNAMNSEGFDALIDDQRETVATVRQHLADQIMDGVVDAQGNTIVVDGLSFAGMRNDTRVAQVDLGAGGINFDFTDTANTGEQIKDAFLQVRDVMRITNNCAMDLVYYISREIATNFERKFSSQYDALIIEQELANLRGVDTFKETNKLTGNQMMAFPLNREKISPIVGMGINTVAMPRPYYNSNYEFVVWGAIGLQIRTDFQGNTCVLYAED